MILKPGYLTLPQLRQIAREQVTLQLDPASFASIDACARAVADTAATRSHRKMNARDIQGIAA